MTGVSPSMYSSAAPPACRRMGSVCSARCISASSGARGSAGTRNSRLGVSVGSGRVMSTMRSMSSRFLPCVAPPSSESWSRSSSTLRPCSSACLSCRSASPGVVRRSCRAASASLARVKHGGSAGTNDSSVHVSSSCAVSLPSGVSQNSVSRLRSVTSQMRTTRTTSRCVLKKPCTRAAMSNAAPQIPDGRRPVCIQSRFICCTRRSADMDTRCVLSPNSSLDAKR
mmetsp:Transcript_11629/g.26138  ORF Transcript_11629/g.26138 Transcript_11629/m.26138 type:complete len:226 (-) Transcript_11629:622-1299(-)